MFAEPNNKPLDRWRSLRDGKVRTFLDSEAEIPRNAQSFRMSLEPGPNFDPRPALIIQRLDDRFVPVTGEDDMGVPLLVFFVIRAGSFINNVYDNTGHSLCTQLIREDEWENVERWPRFLGKNRGFAEFSGGLLEPPAPQRPEMNAPVRRGPQWPPVGVPERPGAQWQAAGAPAQQGGFRQRQPTLNVSANEKFRLSELRISTPRGNVFASLVCNLSLLIFVQPTNAGRILNDRSAVRNDPRMQHMFENTTAKVHFPVMYDPRGAIMNSADGFGRHSGTTLNVGDSYTFSNLLIEPSEPYLPPYDYVAFTEEPKETTFIQKYTEGIEVAVMVPEKMLRKAEWMYPSSDGRYLFKMKGRPSEIQMLNLEFTALASSLMRTGDFMRVGPIIIRTELRERLQIPSRFGSRRFMIDGRILGEAFGAPSEIELS